MTFLGEIPSWHETAACKGKGNAIFYPTRGGLLNEARDICSACPVRDECLESALQNGEHWGVWGMTSEKQRREIRRKANRLCRPRRPAAENVVEILQSLSDRFS